MQSRLIHITFLYFVIIFFSAGCGKKEKNIEGAKIKTAVTILPYADFVKSIGGSLVSISVMVPPGAGPETYDPNPEQMKKLGKADIYFKIGGPAYFEKILLDRILRFSKDMLIIDCSNGITFREDS